MICDLCSTRKICKLTNRPCKHVASELSNCGRALESELIIRKIFKKLTNKLLLHFRYFLFFFANRQESEIVSSQINLKSFISETPLAAFLACLWEVLSANMTKQESKLAEKCLTPSLQYKAPLRVMGMFRCDLVPWNIKIVLLIIQSDVFISFIFRNKLKFWRIWIKLCLEADRCSCLWTFCNRPETTINCLLRILITEVKKKGKKCKIIVNYCSPITTNS